jgi:hypothetical protein
MSECKACQARRRSLAQNNMLHGLCEQVARQAKFHGRYLEPVQWKVLFVSGHSIATGRGAEIVAGLEGEFVNLRESTAKMSKARASSLVEYVLAWCAQNNIILRLPNEA